ncbi:MAG: polysaccharide deacetylase family protein [Marinilabiliaceae bacterium]|nr:polysaccharide deacetylase family protein [Marinilabiliaceae bacterium]
MKNICLYFQLHQPVRLRRYRFFDIGNDHYYYDDYANESNINKLAHTCYLPTNRILLDLIKKYKGKFSVAFSISGTMIDQLKLYAPEVIDSFKELAKTKHAEFLAETSAHSLVSLRNVEEFKRQVAQQVKIIEDTFGQVPVVFRNTELIYSDEIGEVVSQMGFKAILSEGAKQILGWKSSNYMYCNSIEPRLKVLMRNYHMSDDISLRFSNQTWDSWPLTADKFKGWLDGVSESEEVVNLFMNYETFGSVHSVESGIQGFLSALPNVVLSDKNYAFVTPSKAASALQPVSAIHVPSATSWVDEERDVTAWLGNEMQNEAVDKLYALLPLMEQCSDSALLKDWQYLQSSDHFYYMGTKFFANGGNRAYQNPYQTPYDAFINYMNVLTDFAQRLRQAVPQKSQEVKTLQHTIEMQQKEIQELEKQLVKAGVEIKKPAAKRTSSKKSTTSEKVVAESEKKTTRKRVTKK